MGKRGRRNRDRAQLLAQRKADDERRGTQMRIEPTKQKDLMNPGIILPLNKYKSVARNGIILITPQR